MASPKRFVQVIHPPIAHRWTTQCPAGFMFNVSYPNHLLENTVLCPDCWLGNDAALNSLVIFSTPFIELAFSWIGCLDLFDHCLSGICLFPIHEGCLWYPHWWYRSSVLQRTSILCYSKHILFLGLVLDSYLLIAMILIIIPMIFLSIEESKRQTERIFFLTCQGFNFEAFLK